MALEAYEHYWSVARGMGKEERKRKMAKIREKAGVKSGFGSGDDPIGAQSPVIQDNQLQQLSRRAAGRIDDWESLVDPTLSYGENLEIIQRNGGKRIESTKDDDRRDAIAGNDDRQKRRAKRAIRDKIEAIQNDEAEQLIADISAEFSEQFVELAIIEAEALETPDPDAPLATREDVGASPDPIASIETTAEPETPESPEKPAEPEPAKTAEAETTTSPATTTTEPETIQANDYSGVFGTLELVADYVKIAFESGRSDVSPTESRSQTTIQNYA